MDPTELGMNRTGAKTAPMMSKDMAEAAERAAPTSEGDSTTLATLRREYLHEADPVGSVPPPLSAKGVIKAGADALTGKRAHALIDKIGERLAFERTGTRLYETFLQKARQRADELPELPLDDVEHIRNEEAEHFALLADCLRTLGADPTAQTPCADVAGVKGSGLLKTVADPRTSVAQSLGALLTAELEDDAAWELLVELAREAGHDELAQKFQKAADEEAEHLAKVKQWYRAATLASATTSAQSKH